MVIFTGIHSSWTNSVEMLLPEQAESILHSTCKIDLLAQTRIHEISSPEAAQAKLFLKREDESGFGISGCKKRKYASLLHALQREDYRQAVLIGGSASNHVPALAQLLSEQGIAVRVVRKEAHNPMSQGNYLLFRLLVPDEHQWIVQSQDWERHMEIARKLSEQWRRESGQKTILIPEGACCAEALPGACTLLLDIIRNERELQKPFNHIFIDSGTGLTSCALYLMNRYLGRNTTIHVVLTAGDESSWNQQLSKVSAWASSLLGPVPTDQGAVKTWPPVSARSFGSTNATVMRECVKLAREEGILADPVYTAKLIMTARFIVEQKELSGNILIIHGGGGTGLMGFGEKLKAFF